VTAHGKHLLIRFESGLELRSHLGMHGSWHRYAPGERWRRPPARASFVMEVPGAVAVCFDAPDLDLFETRAEPLHPALARLGPDILAPEFDIPDARRRLRTSAAAGRSIAEGLLDQTALAGIGNIYKNESLFAERVDPFSPVERIDDATLDRLIATARRLMLASIEPSARVRRRGSAGTPGVYRRAGRPCPRCGTLIAVRRQGELPRSTYWCPSCQAPRTETKARDARHTMSA
jgi:endonuclease-8